MKRFQRASAFLMALALIVGLLPAGVLPITALDTEGAQKVVNSNYIHASYSAAAITVDGNMTEAAYQRSTFLSGGKLSVAWDKGNLYVAAAAAITSLQINGVAVELTEGAKEVKIAFADAGILDLTKTYAFSVKIGNMEAAWNASLIFDAYVYGDHILPASYSPYFGAEKLEDAIYMDSWYENDEVDDYPQYDGMYCNSRYLTGIKAEVAGTAFVAELDLTIDKLPEVTNSPFTYADWSARQSITNAIVVFVQDGYYVMESNKGTVMPTGLYVRGGKLYLVCTNKANESITEFEVGAFTEGYAYHLRMEYSYRQVSGVTVADVAYYVNGKYIGAAADVYKTNFTTRVGSAGAVQVFVQGSDGTNVDNRAVATVENLSAVNVNADVADYIASYANSVPLFHAAFHGKNETSYQQWNMPVGEDLQARVEWDWDNLYLYLIDNSATEEPAAQNETTLEAVVGGKPFEMNSSRTGTTIPWSEILDGGIRVAHVQTPSISLSVGDFLGFLALDTFDAEGGIGSDYDRTSGRLSYSMGNYLTADANAATVFTMLVEDFVFTNGGVNLDKRDLAAGLTIWITDNLYDSTTKMNPFTIGMYQIGDVRYFVHRYTDENGDAAYEETALDFVTGNEFFIRAEFDYDAGVDGVVDATDPVAAKYYINGVLVGATDNARASSGTALPSSGANVTDSITSGRGTYRTTHMSVGHNDNTIIADRLAIENAAAEVDAQIAALPAVGVLTLNDQEAVATVRAAYTALDDAAKLCVDKLSTLEAAEAEIVRLQAAAEKEAADKAAAQVVIDQIAALPAVGVLALEDKGLVEAAREAYDALTEDAAQYVTNKDVLEAAEAEIARLQAIAEKEAADKAAAQVVIDQIAALPAVGVLTLEDKALVEAAREAYDALAEDVAQYVTNKNVLESAETELVRLQEVAAQEAANKAAAQPVIDQIAALPVVGQLQLTDKEAVKDARRAYNNLTAEAAQYVTNKNVLEAAEAEIDRLQEAADKETFDREKAQAVDALIQALPAVGVLTLEDQANVEAARAAHTALTEDQKAYITQLSVLVAAEAEIARLQEVAENEAAAAEVIAQINAIGTVTLDSEAAIVAAEAAYANLTDVQKGLVTNSATLTAARAAYDKLVTDKAAADAVIAQINGIDDVTLSSQAAIEAAETAYANLTQDQKDLVTNYATLTAARTAYNELVADKAAADAVIAQINGIGDVTLSSQAAIEAAENAYAALTQTQKDQVTNYATLTAARTAYDKLVADKAAADAVIAQIDAIGTVALESVSDIVTAETAYAALTPDQKALVTNHATLIAARARYDELKAAADKAEIDQAAADGVIAKIEAIGEVTLASKTAIEDAENAYAALTPDQKALVTNEATLTAARATYNNLKATADQAAADAVIAQINTIGTVTLESETAIKNAETAYAALTAEQKALVANYATLTAARATYDELKAAAEKEAADKAAADAAADKIEAIGEVTLESKAAIEAARAAYDALTADQKALVSEQTLKALTDAEAALKTLEEAAKEAADKAAADAAADKIEAIGEVTLESKAAIEAARAAYDALTADQKALVSEQTLKALTDAEAALKALQDAADKEEEEEIADETAAQAAADKIEAIGTVTLSSQAAIKAARAAYDALTAEQKALVGAQILKKLTDAEAALEALLATDEAPKTGDDAMVVPVALLVGLSFTGMAVLVADKKKRMF